MADLYPHTPETIVPPHVSENRIVGSELPSTLGVGDFPNEIVTVGDVPNSSLPKRAAQGVLSLCAETSEALRPYHPGITVIESAGYKLKRITEAVKLDYRENENKARAGTLGGLALATQAVDRLRFGVVLVPKVATEVLENTQAATPTALAAAAVFMGWNFTVGEVANYAVDEYPRTVDQFKEEFPTFVALFEQSLPGMRQDDAADANQEKNPSLFKRASKQTFMHTKRAFSGVSLGSTAYVATAAAQGRTRKERTKINAQVTAATGVLVGGLGATVALSVLELPKRGHAWAAEKISSTVGNMKVWWGVAAGMIGGDYYLNKKQVKEQNDTDSILIDGVQLGASTTLIQEA